MLDIKCKRPDSQPVSFLASTSRLPSFRAFNLADISFRTPHAACFMALCEVMVCCRRMAASLCCLFLDRQRQKIGESLSQ